MGARIVPVERAADRRAFLDFGYRHYDGVTNFVPPLRLDLEHTLNPKKNAFFEHGAMQLFLARDASGHVIGRIAAIRNGMHLKKYQDGVGFFGFFECIDDATVAHALFDAAAGWLRDQGLAVMRGPANPSLNDTAGLLVDGFQFDPSILMPYNHPYYETLLLGYGFERAITLWSYYVHRKYIKTDKMRRGAEIVKRRNPNLTTRPLEMARFDQEARTILEIYNDAWSDNWGHVPMTEGEFAQLAKALKQIIDPNLVVLLEDQGTPVAFAISLPNLNIALRHVKDGKLLPLGLAKLLAYTKMGQITEIRMPLMGVRKAYQGRALDMMLIDATVQYGWGQGYQGCEMSWVLDNNKVLRNALENLGGIQDKQYGLYDKALESLHP